MFNGKIARLKIYPVTFTSGQIQGFYKREHTWWGRILNKTKGKYTAPLCEILDNRFMHIIGTIHNNPELLEEA